MSRSARIGGAAVLLAALALAALGGAPAAGAPQSPTQPPWTGVNCVPGDGPRVQVVYAHRADKPNRLGKVRAQIVASAIAADQMFLRSAMWHESRQQLRWAVSEDCALDILTVTQKAGPTKTFFDWLPAMTAAGLTRLDRKYLVYVDDEFWPCGQGMGEGGWIGQTYPRPGRPGVDNPNNGHVLSVGRLARTCWSDRDRGGAAAHELMHMLGAVQAGAPAADGDGHIKIPGDPMGGNNTTDNRFCPANARDVFDCLGIAYYNPHPAPRSWLATHWNTARSSFLAAPQPSQITIDPRGTLAGWVRLRTTVSVPSGQGWTLRWMGPADCRIISLATRSGLHGTRDAWVKCQHGETITAVLTQTDGTTIARTAAVPARQPG